MIDELIDELVAQGILKKEGREPWIPKESEKKDYNRRGYSYKKAKEREARKKDVREIIQ